MGAPSHLQGSSNVLYSVVATSHARSLDVTGCMSLPFPTQPAFMWASGSRQLLICSVRVWQLFTLGAPSHRRGCGFSSSIPAGVLMVSDIEGVSLALFVAGRAMWMQWTCFTSVVSVWCSPLFQELLNKNHLCKPQIFPECSLLSLNWAGCALCTCLAPGQDVLGWVYGSCSP